MIPLPPANQTRSYDCGAACLRAVCEYFGVGPKDEGDYIKACKSDEDAGTRPADLVAAATRMGLEASARTGVGLRGLSRCLRAGVPVVCAIQAWGDGGEDYRDNKSGHYVVAMGMGGGHVYFQDPSVSGSRGKLPYAEFLKRWHDEDADGVEYSQLAIAMWSRGGPRGEESQRTRSRRIK